MYDQRVMDRVDPRTQQCRVEIHVDESYGGEHGMTDACGDGFTFGTANPRSTHYVEYVPDIAKGDRLFILDVYEHGQVQYSLAGNGMQCQFDTARGGAFIILHADAGWNMDNAEEIARGLADSITAWANGWIYGYVIEDMTGKDVDSCWGFMDTGNGYFIEEIKSAIGDLIVVETNDLAASMGITKEVVL